MWRSWRVVKMFTVLRLVRQNWAMGLIFSDGVVAISDDFGIRRGTWVAWYALSGMGLVLCSSFMRFGGGWLRNRGDNIPRAAVPGDSPPCQSWLSSLRSDPSLRVGALVLYRLPPPACVSYA
ncbi:hypothetical protein [Salmonella enterica]|uniref:hypothetical protein n=1 Tax=Salmonella enterica TaxID=28901 RepID=UPI00398C4687